MKLILNEVNEAGETVKGVEINAPDQDLAMPLDMFVKIYVEPAMAQGFSKGDS